MTPPSAGELWEIDGIFVNRTLSSDLTSIWLVPGGGVEVIQDYKNQLLNLEWNAGENSFPCSLLTSHAYSSPHFEEEEIIKKKTT